MKKLESKAIEQLLSIIPNHPATRILHISSGGEEFCKALDEFTREREFEYQLNVVDEDFYLRAKELFEDSPNFVVKKMDYNQRRYTTMAKLYDFVFVTATVPTQIEEEFVKKVHSLIKNGGNIILFLPKDDKASKYRWFQTLEENFYVATNSIDIFDNYEIVIAKKMHGWGG